MNLKVHCATNYKSGEECKEWLKKHLPPSWEYTDDKDKCDCFISVMSKEIIKKDFIDKRPCFNFHFGILPQWKGSGIIPQVIVKGDAIHLLSRPLKNHAAAVALGKKIVKAGTADIYKNWFDLNKGEEIGLFAIFGGQFRNL